MEFEFNKKKISAIINGIVIDPSTNTLEQRNIFIKDGLISEISNKHPSNKDGIIDVKGMHISSGFIDMHVHLREPGFEQKEDIESGSKAAAAGGFTTILCMPNTNPVNDSIKVTKLIKEKASKVNLTNIIPIASMTKGLIGEELTDYDKIINEGVIAISDDGKCVQNESVLSEVFSIAKEKNLLVISHPEILSKNNNGAINDGEVSKKLNVPGIPRSAENDAIERDIKLAENTGARLHIAHVSTKEGVELIRKAKSKGIKLTAEVTPHHLLLTEDAINEIGTNAKMSPPLRTRDDCDALIEGLNDKTIDIIATDHAPHEASSKNTNIMDASFGIVGLETMLPLILKLVHEKKISLNRFVELTSMNPAKILNLNDRGTITVGKRADVTIIDINREITVNPDNFYSKGRNSPFSGWRLKGKVIYTIKEGGIIFSG